MRHEGITVKELIEKLQQFSPDAEVVVMGFTTDEDGEDRDDYRPLPIVEVHDKFYRNDEPGTMVSLEVPIVIEHDDRD